MRSARTALLGRSGSGMSGPPRLAQMGGHGVYAPGMESHVASKASEAVRQRLGRSSRERANASGDTVRDQLLVVDDDATDRLLIRRLLADGATVGLKMVEAETAQEAVEMLRTHRVACMLIDQVLPDMTGLDLLNMLANIEPVGLILVSGVMDVSLSRDAIRLGAHDVLPKDDMDTARLSLAIHAAIGTARVRQQMAEHSQRLELFFALADECRDYLFVIDLSTGVVVEANAEIRRISGADRTEVHAGKLSAERIFAAGPTGWKRLRASIEYYGQATVELEVFNGPGRRMPIEIRARRVTHGPRQYMICVGREVSRERGLEREVIRLRDPDQLTGLPSREAFMGELERSWNWAMNDDTALVLTMLSISWPERYTEDMRAVMLRQAGQALLGNVRRSNELVGRYSENSFAVIATGGDEVVARKLADRLRMLIRGACAGDVESAMHPPHVAAGIALGRPSDIGSVSEFMDLAAQALDSAQKAETGQGLHLLAV